MKYVYKSTLLKQISKLENDYQKQIEKLYRQEEETLPDKIHDYLISKKFVFKTTKSRNAYPYYDSDCIQIWIILGEVHAIYLISKDLNPQRDMYRKFSDKKFHAETIIKKDIDYFINDKDKKKS